MIEAFSSLSPRGEGEGGEGRLSLNCWRTLRHAWSAAGADNTDSRVRRRTNLASRVQSLWLLRLLRLRLPSACDCRPAGFSL